jgi:hypothetical protein
MDAVYLAEGAREELEKLARVLALERIACEIGPPPADCAPSG